MGSAHVQPRLNSDQLHLSSSRQSVLSLCIWYFRIWCLVVFSDQLHLPGSRQNIMSLSIMVFGILRLVVLLDQFTSPVQDKVSCHFIFGIFSSDRSSLRYDVLTDFINPFFLQNSAIPFIRQIESVHCREEGCIGLYIPDDQDISRSPMEISRSEGMCNPIHPD